MPIFGHVAEWLASWGEIFSVREVWEGFLCGLAVGLILTLGIPLLCWLVFRRRRRCRAIIVPGDGGSLSISAQAVREFMQRIIADFSELELLAVNLRRRKRLTDISVKVNAVPGANVRQLKDALMQVIRQETTEKMGLEDLLGDVNVEIQKYSASERKIARKASRVHGNDSVPTPPPPALLGPELEAETATPANEPQKQSEDNEKHEPKNEQQGKQPEDELIPLSK